MTHFMAFAVLSLALLVVTVQSNEIGDVHAELKHMLHGKSDGDIMELKKKLAREREQEHDRQHEQHLQQHEAADDEAGDAGDHPRCPFGFGSQRKNGCCASLNNDDLTTATHDCVTETKENGKDIWEIFDAGANSKFTCCPKKQDSKAQLKNDLEKIPVLDADKEQNSVEVGFDGAEEVPPAAQDVPDTTEEEMSNQLNQDRKKNHAQNKHAHESEYASEEEMAQDLERERSMHQQMKSRKAREQAVQSAVNRSESDTSSGWCFLIVGMIGFGIFYLVNDVNTGGIEIPGLGNVDLGEMVRDLFPSHKKFPATTYMFDKSSQDAAQISLGQVGAYGGAVGHGAGTALNQPVYESQKLAPGFRPIEYESQTLAMGIRPTSAGVSHAAPQAPPQAVRAAPKPKSAHSFAALPEEDFGL